MKALSFSTSVPRVRAEESSSFVSGSRVHIRKAFFGVGLVRIPSSGVDAGSLRHLDHVGSRYVRRFSTFARIKKGQKHEYPWPDNIDPNLESGHLAYLSYFKPLAEKPKLVTLDFEKPLVELEKKIIDVRKMSDETGLDFTDQINELESKYQQALKDLYTHLTPFQRVAIARHPNRPTFLDHVLNITDKWVELHGDRAGYDDPAVVTGLGSIDGKTYMFIGHQKGRNTKENIHRNFGMPTPHGYRKALRMMRYADHHGFPIITFIDTPGAFADLKSEELGQGEAIAFNLREMFGLKVPIVSVVIGEGGSGGALAIGCANKLFMLENAVFYVASPEACAAILWKNSQEAPKAAEKLKITGTELCKLKVADDIIPEPLGGAHTDPTWTSQQIKIKVLETMKELSEMETDKLLEHRYKKFRIIGEFIEGEPVEEEKKWSMKKKEADYALDMSDLEADIETLKKAVEEANGKATSPALSFEMVENLRQQVDKEITDAFIAMGLQEKLQDLKMEMSLSPDGTPSAPLQERIDRLMQEFKYNLSRPGSYMELKAKLETLGEASKLLEEKTWREFNDNLRQEQVKEKIEILRAKREKSVNGQLWDQDQVEQMNKVKEELLGLLELYNLESFGLTRRNKQAVPGREMLRKAEQMINMEIERAVDEAGLRSKIDLLRQELKAEIESDSNDEKIEKLESEIKAQIAAAIDMDKLKKKVNNDLLTAFGKDIELIKDELEVAIDKAGIRSRINELREELKIEVETDLSYEKIEKLQTKIREEIVAAVDMVNLKKKIEDGQLRVQETVGVGQFQG